MLLKESELSATPAPFLNRFEKYRITYDSLISECMANLPPFMRIILETAVDKVTHTAVRMFMFVSSNIMLLLIFWLVSTGQ